MLTSAVSMGQLQQGIDTTAHNLANVNTTGYQRREAMFSDLLFQQINNQQVPQPEGNRLTPPGIRSGSGAAMVQSALRFEQGSVKESERDLDFALISPNHFFPVEREGETFLTRDGAFYLSESGDNTWRIVSGDGAALLQADGTPFEITGQAQSFTLQADGTLVAQMADGQDVALGTLNLANVSKPQMLESIGNNLFALPDVEALDLTLADVLEYEAANNGTVVQGALEQANVDMAQEMVKLMEMQRLYSMHARSLRQTDQMMGLVNSLR
ncbi:flagellar hook-basal body protein [Geomicrobium sp. JCM 19038]|uniref:flagellar hook-basal body protein n=1 Tax=Geomicrobium sp. JCM 19038 TaxID=1460635 RepID=UPI00045F42AC|nr:flagellar hook-basal body protein [Geomicrobium sp. JCM 19038]GAK07055.1 flagellar basal-body rod protein FlgG [Geomicrobium sp. JCM 19038]